MSRYFQYYVYTLSYPDGRVFYVGRSQGTRIDQHEKEAQRYRDAERGGYLTSLPKESPTTQVIREIQSAGGKVIKSKVFQTDSEQEAIDYKTSLIARYGEQTLTNRTRGGGPQYSIRDPYARLKRHRPHYYTPAEAQEKLSVSALVWGRLALAGVVKFYAVEGCRAPVLQRAAIDALAEKIKQGSYPIDVWE